MTESTHVVDLVQSRINEFLSTRDPIVALISPDLVPLVAFSRQFLSGGKRFRALFCYWGWQSVRAGAATSAPAAWNGPGVDDLSPITGAASALEVFHAAALVHDDIIDNSDTRRGAASAHKLFERLHGTKGWVGSSTEFGRDSAILLGDLLLGWSDELLDEGLAALPDREAALAARSEFNLMRTEVTAGQYLDILEERAWHTAPESELCDRAMRVIEFKSARYSVLAPLVIGAALAGGSAEQLASLRAFGLPLGIAYQLRDDLLGVFGDASVTGKPSGDDLREGKRTVLIALARQTLSAQARRVLDEQLGDPALDATRIATLQQSITHSGAVERVEALITERLTEALTVLDTANISGHAKNQLRGLADKVARRAF
ncbi:polyprenyl synthetase family protein [Cryobacterium psychrophilum]|uniref:Polyprenyl synthetase family protein n=1 Tax=Cryobacterium psychrophilum TaxID=41988 RepID=A0A4Y8KPX0_9MICO|nr:polyprenyl synthetase family protein [Cryobacterium psychrophilum]TDW31481.1 geranylgeranyl diphosphate synthase type I [Cryobacterium psychrophilum]TFD78912.1 polyprenyl synthetase family protein [Cryobacterium psychrophilum]